MLGNFIETPHRTIKTSSLKHFISSINIGKFHKENNGDFILCIEVCYKRFFNLTYYFCALLSVDVFEIQTEKEYIFGLPHIQKHTAVINRT